MTKLRSQGWNQLKQVNVIEIHVLSLGLKMSLQEHRRKLEKQHFCERWPGGFSWLPLQNIKLDGLSWPINFHILLKGHEGPAAVVCKLHLRRCSDSLRGVQPEAWGGLACKTCSSWSGLSWGEAGLSWGLLRAALLLWAEVTMDRWDSGPCKLDG